MSPTREREKRERTKRGETDYINVDDKTYQETT